MKLSEMIKNLQEFMTKHGDIECWCAKDDEGNGYQKVHYEPELYYVSKADTVYTDDVYVSLEDVEDNDLSVSNVRPICVVN